MSRGRFLVADAPEQAPRKPVKAVDDCAAEGCPLLGTIRRENGAGVCSAHYRANADGWPLATEVVAKFADLFGMARNAQCAPTPEAMSGEIAADLFRIAKAAGVKFNDAQREQYRDALARQAMPLRLAGVIVEEAIIDAAVAAAGSSVVVVPIGGRRMSKLELAIRGVASRLDAAA